MKISICGKGGCGKSTIITLLGKELAKRRKEVLIIDSDESNYGLHRHLGLANPNDFTEYFGGKEQAFNELQITNFTHQFFKESWTFEDIPEGYYTERDGMKLMVSGKIKQANEGCACTMGNILKQFITNLRTTENQFTLVDMEAGIEHFGRGLDDSVDLIMMVCDPSYESIQLATKVKELGDHIGKPVCYVLNKVDPDTKEMLETSLKYPELIIAELMVTPSLLKASLKGDSLTGEFQAIETIADYLLNI